MFQIIGQEKETFLEHVWCGSLFKKSNSLTRLENFKLQFSCCNWIVASEKLDLVDVVTFEILFVLVGQPMRCYAVC